MSRCLGGGRELQRWWPGQRGAAARPCVVRWSVLQARALAPVHEAGSCVHALVCPAGGRARAFARGGQLCAGHNSCMLLNTHSACHPTLHPCCSTRTHAAQRTLHAAHPGRSDAHSLLTPAHLLLLVHSVCQVCCCWPCAREGDAHMWVEVVPARQEHGQPNSRTHIQGRPRSTCVAGWGWAVPCSAGDDS